MSTNGQLVFTDVDKITFKGVGNASNAVIDTLTGKIGVGVDSPEANLHVLGNSYVSTNLELGGTLIMGTVNVEAQHSLEAVTATGNITPLTIEFTNPTTSLVASGNVVVTGNVTADHFVGDGSNITGISSTLQAITDSGPGANVTSNTVQFSNAITSLTAASNVVVTGNVTAGSFLGDGSELTALNAANIGSGTLPVSRGGTGTTLSTGTGALVLQNAPSFTGDVNVGGQLQINSFNAKRVLIGYQIFTNATGSSWSDSTSGWQNAWSVNYVRKKAGSHIYVIADVCLAQAMGGNGTASYRGIDVRLKVYDQVSDRFSNLTRDWQRIDNSSHEYQRQSRVHFPPHTLPGAQAGWTVTVVAQVSRTSGSGTRGSFGINIWSGRSFIEVFETMES